MAQKAAVTSGTLFRICPRVSSIATPPPVLPAAAVIAAQNEDRMSVSTSGRQGGSTI